MTHSFKPGDVPASLAEVQRLRAELIHFRDEWTTEGDSTWLWLGRILDGEQGCTFHSGEETGASQGQDPMAGTWCALCLIPSPAGSPEIHKPGCVTLGVTVPSSPSLSEGGVAR